MSHEVFLDIVDGDKASMFKIVRSYANLCRPLVTGITYATPSPNPTPPNAMYIPDTHPVTFAYDAAGNRMNMTDGTGSLNYSYDALSRLTTETKDFTDSLSNAPSGGVYTTTYNYDLAGGIKSITDPFGYVVSYSSDKVGRMTAIGNASVSTAYASGISYRAFGGVKALSLSSGTSPIAVTLTYDPGFRPSGYTAHNSVSGDIHNSEYSYSNDGMISGIANSADANFNQANEYDFAGRLKLNDVGESGETTHPYKQTLIYDAFNNITKRETWTYNFTKLEFNASYANNRKSGSDEYDAAGNILSSYAASPLDSLIWQFDAAGRQTRWEEIGPYGSSTQKGKATTYDGDGQAVKEGELTKTYTTGTGWGSWSAENSYFIFSSVTHQPITQLTGSGAHNLTNVYMGGSLIARQDAETTFQLTDPVTGSTQLVDHNGVKLTGTESRSELAGLGTEVPSTEPPDLPPPNNHHGTTANPEMGCFADGGPISCSTLFRWLGTDWLSHGSGKIYWKATTVRHTLYLAADNESHFVDTAIARGAPSVNFPNFNAVGFLLGSVSETSFSSTTIGGGWGDLSAALERDFTTLQSRLSAWQHPPNASKLWGPAVLGDADKDLCETMVLKPLASIGLNINEFLGYLKKGADFLDGTTSTLDANWVFGNNLVAGSPQIPKGWSVSTFFSAARKNAITSFSLSAARLTIFFDPSKANSSVGLVFHEAIHGYGAFLNNGKSAGAFSDAGLLKLFKLNQSKGSDQIEDYIDRYCGAYLTR